DPTRLFAMTVETRRTPYQREGMTARLADEMLRRVRALPGVRAAAFGSNVPVYGGRGSRDDITVGDAPDGSGESAWFAAVTPNYFTVMGMTLQQGRDVSALPGSIGPGATTDVVVNEQFAKKFFPGRQ